MAVETYYDVLGVPRDATPEQIKKAYWAVARECHPDKTGEDPEARVRYERACTAHKVLLNDQSRAMYDLTIRTPQNVRELFARYPAGQRLLETRLPKASAEPVPGVHIVGILEVPMSLLQNGGSVILPSFGKYGPPEGTVLRIPPGTQKTPWARFSKMGDRGHLHAEDGDFLLYFVQKL